MHAHLCLTCSRRRGSEASSGPCSSIFSTWSSHWLWKQQKYITCMQQQQPVMCGTFTAVLFVHLTELTRYFAQMPSIHKFHMFIRHLTHPCRQHKRQQCTHRYGSDECDSGDLLWPHRWVSVVAQSPWCAWEAVTHELTTFFVLVSYSPARHKPFFIPVCRSSLFSLDSPQSTPVLRSGSLIHKIMS